MQLMRTRFGFPALGTVVTWKDQHMFQKLTTVVIIGSALVLAACNTVRGAARDVNSAANTVDNAM